MGNRKLLAISVLLATGGLFWSCGRQEKVLARVGDQKISLQEFEEVYRPQPNFGDSAAVQEQKRKILDQLIEPRLLALAAKEQGADKDPQLLSRYQDLKKNILLSQLYKIEILDRVKPTESEIRNFYKHLGTEIKARHILVRTEAEAKEVLSKLKAGSTFEDLARQLSLDQSSGQQGGSLGWFGWGNMVDEFQKAAFALKPGQMSQPVETGFGYHIIRLDSVRSVEVQPLDSLRERIKRQLAQTKPREMTTKYLSALKKQAGIKVQDEVLARIAEKQVPGDQGLPPRLPELSPEEGRLVLVKYNGGSWTAAQFFEQAQKMMGGMIDLKNQAMVKKQIEALLTGEFLYKKALAKGLDRQPDVRRQMERAWNDLMAGVIYRREVQEKVKIDSQAVRDYYRQHKSEFFQPSQAMIHIIVVKTQPEAEEIYRLLSQGADFASLARERSIDWSRNTGGVLGLLNPKDPNYPEVAARAFSLPLNQLSRPFSCRDGYAVIKVSKREPAVQRTFEQVRQDIESRLQQAREEEIFQELIARLKERYPVTIDQALLAQAGEEKGKR